MKYLLYILLLISSSCIGQVRDYNLRIGSDKDPDSTYCLVTAVTGSNFAGRGQFKSLPQLAALIEGYLVVTETQGIDDVLSQSEAFTTNRDINAAGYTFEIKTATERVLGMNDAIDTYYVGKYNNGASLQFASTNLSWITNSGANSLFGINTVAPNEALDVVGNGLFSGTLNASNLSGTNTGDQDLSGYTLESDTASMLSHYIERQDTASMLSHYIERQDTASMLSTYIDRSSAETIYGVKTFNADPIVPAEAYAVGWNGSNEPPTKNDVYDKIEMLGGGAAYLVYIANIDFAGGTADPTAVVFENTLGGSIVWTWEGTGEFLGTLAGMFPDESRVWIMVYPGADDENRNVSTYTDSSNEIIFEVVNLSGVPQNPSASSLYHIEIRVYP